MTLAAIASGASPAIRIPELGAHADLARELQAKLIALGILDPPVDGKFGPVSTAALRFFLNRAGLSTKAELDREVASRLIAPAAETLVPLHPKSDLAGRIVQRMLADGHWICRRPDCVNVVYVEGVNLDGSLNDNRPNRFNDARFILRVATDGMSAIEGAWDGTTEPGKFWTERPMGPAGAARIAFGQYKAWSVGVHNASKPSAHEALVQVDSITVFRDLNKDFRRQGDQTQTGIFSINQHWGFNYSPDDIRDASAGCLVGRTKTGHREFMKIVKGDARFIANNGYKFITTVIDGRTLPA